MTIYQRPEGLIDPNPTLAQSLGAIVGTLGGKAISAYSQNKAINNIQEQLKSQGVSPALATLAAAQVGRTGSLSAPIANLIKGQQQTQNLSNYYQQRWGLSPEQASNLAGTPENIQKQELENLSIMERLRQSGVYPSTQPVSQPTMQPNQDNQIPTQNTQKTLPGLPGLVISDDFSQNIPPESSNIQQPTPTTANNIPPVQNRFTPDQLQRLAIADPKRAEEIRKQYESEDKRITEQQKIQQKDITIAQKSNADYIKEVDANRNTLEREQSALEQIGIANTSGNLGFGFDLNTVQNLISRIPGFEWLRTKDAAAYEAGVKNSVIAQIQEVGTRNNKLIDKTMLSAAGSILDKDSSRYIIQFGKQGQVNKLAEKIRITDEIIAEDTEKYGYVKPNLSQRVYKRAAKFYEEENKRTLEKFKKAEEGYGFYYARDFSDPNSYLNAPVGTPLTKEAIDFYLRKNNMDPRKAEADAYNNGYRPKKSWYQKGALDLAEDYIRS